MIQDIIDGKQPTELLLNKRVAYFNKNGDYATGKITETHTSYVIINHAEVKLTRLVGIVQ